MARAAITGAASMKKTQANLFARLMLIYQGYRKGEYQNRRVAKHSHKARSEPLDAIAPMGAKDISILIGLPLPQRYSAAKLVQNIAIHAPAKDGSEKLPGLLIPF